MCRGMNLLQHRRHCVSNPQILVDRHRPVHSAYAYNKDGWRYNIQEVRTCCQSSRHIGQYSPFLPKYRQGYMSSCPIWVQQLFYPIP